MASISVKTSTLRRISGQGTHVQERISSISNRLVECYSTLYAVGSSYGDVTVTLKGLAARTEDNSVKVGTLFRQLEGVANLYKNTEASIAQNPIVCGTKSKNASAGLELEVAGKQCPRMPKLPRKV